MGIRKTSKIIFITVLTASCIYWLTQVAIQIYIYCQFDNPTPFRVSFINTVFLYSMGAVSTGTLSLFLLIPIRSRKNTMQVITLVSCVMGVILFYLSFATNRGLLDYLPLQIFQQPRLIVGVSIIGCAIGTIIGLILFVVQLCITLVSKNNLSITEE